MKLVIAVGVLAGLAACSTTPQPVLAPIVSTVSTTSVSGTTPTPSLPVSPGFVVTPPDASLSEPFDASVRQFPRPALLAGESAREYQRGGASWYGPGFHGRRTASGERYDMNAMTAAHRTLPFGTWVRIRSLVNGREVDVRITDRGPFIHSRVIDVSRGAAQALGMMGLGFKEVVLLVPDTLPVSAPAVVDRPLPVVKRRGVVQRGRNIGHQHRAVNGR